ncbi:Ribonuclease/ribotoxin [Jimgerdemannia flammicorona]|uniref:Ribonuclease/ribotoxin n=1 Tax=Jimgerdemannia flammicorona TaxID=994334 RepID=A0A433DD12_9FUNG|nr:Ribonuclease/ribotoxin [Jimgerdemannia flammicorona]
MNTSFRYIIILVLFASLSLAIQSVQLVQSVQSVQSIETFKCGNNSYNRSQLQAAVNRSLLCPPGSRYPHVFNNRENITFTECNTTRLWEYPVLPQAVYNCSRPRPNPPGPDRVIYSDNLYKLCIPPITHTGAPNNSSFVPCNTSRFAT